MAISFAKIKKIEIRKYLIHTLLIIGIFAALFYLRRFFLEEVQLELPQKIIKRIKLDFNFLEEQKTIFDELQLFEEIKPFEGVAGRENPFISY